MVGPSGRATLLLISWAFIVISVAPRSAIGQGIGASHANQVPNNQAIREPLCLVGPPAKGLTTLPSHGGTSMPWVESQAFTYPNNVLFGKISLHPTPSL